MATPSERLKELMNIKNLKQIDIIERTGLKKSSVSSYVSGTRKPKSDVIMLIADCYNVAPAWLSGFDVPMEKSAKDEAEMLVDISENEQLQRLIAYYNALTPKNRKMVLNLMEQMVDDDEG